MNGVRLESGMYVVPSLVAVFYNGQMVIMNKCFNCGDRFIRDERLSEDPLRCSSCVSEDIEYPDENISPDDFKGIIVDFKIEVSSDKKRRYMNYKKVFVRDNFQCQYCGFHPIIFEEKVNMTIDHIKPHSAGGKNGMNNLVCACSSCNGLLSNKWFNDFHEKKIYIFEKRKQRGMPIYWSRDELKEMDQYKDLLIKSK